MEKDDKNLMDRYNSLTTETLVDIARKGTLTKSAVEILNAVLASRGVAIEDQLRIRQQLENEERSISNTPTRAWILVSWWAGAMLVAVGELSGSIGLVVDMAVPAGYGLSYSRQYAASYAVLYAMTFMVGVISSRWVVSRIDACNYLRYQKNVLKLLLVPVYSAIAVLLGLLRMIFS